MASKPKITAKNSFLEEVDLEYAAEYRSMHTAIHHLIVVNDERVAKDLAASLKVLEKYDGSDYAQVADALSNDDLARLKNQGTSVEDIEVNFRNKTSDDRYFVSGRVIQVVAPSVDVYL